MRQNGRPALRRGGSVLALLLALALVWPATARSEEEPEGSPPQAPPGPTGLLRADRLQHTSLALSCGLSVGLVTERPAAALGVAVGLALVKEVWDRRRSGFDRGDLLAGVIGAAMAGIATQMLRR